MIVVVAGQEQEVNGGWGVFPLQMETECGALGIGLALKQLARSMVGTHWVRVKQLLRWWEAGTRRSNGGGGSGQQY